MHDPRDQAKFWRLLTDYEALTRRETVAIRHQDYPSLTEAQRLKADIFPVWRRLGKDLHLNRENCPELRARLEVVASAEAANLEAITGQREDVQARLEENTVARQRLRKVGRNYHDGWTGGAPSTGFAARG